MRFKLRVAAHLSPPNTPLRVQEYEYVQVNMPTVITVSDLGYPHDPSNSRCGLEGRPRLPRHQTTPRAGHGVPEVAKPLPAMVPNSQCQQGSCATTTAPYRQTLPQFLSAVSAHHS